MSDDGDRRNRPWRPGLDLAEYVDGLMEKHKPGLAEEFAEEFEKYKKVNYKKYQDKK